MDHEVTWYLRWSSCSGIAHRRHVAATMLTQAALSSSSSRYRLNVIPFYCHSNCSMAPFKRCRNKTLNHKSTHCVWAVVMCLYERLLYQVMTHIARRKKKTVFEIKEKIFSLSRVPIFLYFKFFACMFYISVFYCLNLNSLYCIIQ